MKAKFLYLLTPLSEGSITDDYFAVVVRAANEDRARLIHPNAEAEVYWDGLRWVEHEGDSDYYAEEAHLEEFSEYDDEWYPPQDVVVMKLGRVTDGSEEGVVLSSIGKEGCAWPFSCVKQKEHGQATSTRT